MIITYRQLTKLFTETQGARPPVGPHPRRFRLLLPDGAGIRRRRPPAARASLAGRRGALVDSQAPREDLRDEPHPAAPGHARNPVPLRARRSMRRTLTGAPYAEYAMENLKGDELDYFCEITD